MTRKRVYTEKEFGAVLERAAELQREQGLDDSPGLSLQELEQIGADAGMDPEIIKRAALELEEGEPDTSFSVLGGPTTIDVERIVDGPLSQSAWEASVGAIRHAFAADGDVRREGRAWEWTHEDQMDGRVQVTMQPAGNQTRIHISYRITPWIWGMHVPAVSVSFGVVAIVYTLLNLGVVLETGIAMFAVMASYLLARLAFAAFSRRQDHKARRLLSQLDDLISAPQATAVKQPEQIAATQAGRIDSSLLSDEVPPAAASPKRSREREDR